MSDPSLKKILIIVSGSIAAIKLPEIIKSLREKDFDITCVLTKAGEKFITPLTLASLTCNEVYTDLFSLKDEVEMGHIQLSRQADLLVVLPASADIIAKMANGFADDLASTILLATNKPVLIAPAMNTKMWENKAVQRNIEVLQKDGVEVMDTEEGSLACGEYGKGRLATADKIVEKISSFMI